MSLYGALFSGVAGLTSQSTDLSIIADNISNVNTVGYKGGNALFETLVTGTSSNTTYSSGGVIGGNHQTVDQQGLLQSTQSPTDIAIQGSGLFVVNQTSDGTGQVLYTRAGSFTQDASGNFKNSAGFFLQAWPLDSSGRLPGAPGNTDTTSSANLSSLQTVNVQSVAGSASATSTVSLSANLSAGATAYPGTGVTGAMDPQDSLNFGITANSIIVPGSTDGLAAGDQFSVTTGSGLSYKYNYGGYTYSRDVVNGGATGASGAATHTATATLTPGTATATPNATSTTPAASSSTPATTTDTPAAVTVGTSNLTVTSVTDGTGSNKNVITVTYSGSLPQALQSGDYVNIGGAGATPFDGTITQSDMNGSHQITVTGANTFTFTVADAGTVGGQTDSDSITGAQAPFVTTAANTVVVNEALPAGLSAGDWVTISGASAFVGGQNINGTFQIANVDPYSDGEHFSITVPSAAPTTPPTAVGSTTAVSVTPSALSTNGTGTPSTKTYLNIAAAPPSGAVANQTWVTITGNTPSSIDGVPTNGTFLIKQLVDSTHYIVDTGTSANSANPTSATMTSSSFTATISPFTTLATSGAQSTFLRVAGAPPAGAAVGDWITLSGTSATINGVPTQGTFQLKAINAGPPASYDVDTGTAATGIGGGYANTTPITSLAATVAPLVTGAATTNTLTIFGTPPVPASGTAAVGDWVTLSGNVPGTINGVPTNGTFQIASITAASVGTPAQYTVTTTGTSTGAGGTTQSTASGAVTITCAPFTTNTHSSAHNTYLNIAEPPPTDAIVGDWVTLSGNVPATVNGLPTNGTFQIKSITTDPTSGNAIAYSVDTGTAVGSGITTTAQTGGYTTQAVATTAVGAAIEPFAVAANSNVVTVYQPGAKLNTGDVVTLSGNTADIGTIPAADLNGEFVVTRIDDNHFTITVADTNGSTGAAGGTGTITDTMRPFAGNILDASTTTQPFLGVTGTSGFTAAALSFTISTSSATSTFTYTASSPNAQLGQFNNMNNLATAINDTTGLSARVVNNKLYVSAIDASSNLTFANGDVAGTSGPPVQAGIDWITELGLANVASGTNRFSTMQGLADLVNASAGMTATITNPLSASSIKINANDPLTTLTVADRPVPANITLAANPFTTTNGSKTVTITTANPLPAGLFTNGSVVHLNGSALAGAVNGIPKADFTGNFTISNVGTSSFTITVADAATADGAGGAAGVVLSPPTNSGSILSTLGIGASNTTTPETTGVLAQAYDPTVDGKNMASGAITPQFSRPITVYDALGTAHNLNVGFIKTASNTWAVEVYAQPATDVTSNLPNGLITYGSVSFNGDGSLLSVDATLTQQQTINWNDGAEASKVTFNWGTAGEPFGTVGATVIGKTDGLSQFNSDYKVNFANQNGAPVGSLTGVSIDNNGFIIASYSNGQTQKLYQIPIAMFASFDQLQSVSGNVYEQSAGSGQVTLAQASTNGAGSVSSSSLESSNVELASQLTDMIVAQRSYQANTKVISTADQLLNALDQILQ